jgi:hypothetical protein
MTSRHENQSQWLPASCSEKINRANNENARTSESNSPVTSVDTVEETGKTCG